MQLRNARLCLDCEEVHDAPHCPLCASESFAFITRWVPSPSAESGAAAAASADGNGQSAATPVARPQPRERPQLSPTLEPVSRETLDTYRQLLTDQPAQGSNWRLVKRGAVGLALFGLAGWAWKQQNQRGAPPDDRRSDDRRSDDGD